jgi:endonuclease/exonuclease/phosphatase family metal-dependent hydrolase
MNRGIRLRLITLNIAHGRGLAPVQGLASQARIRANLDRIASFLHRFHPDIVAMQEIDQRSRWSGNFDHLDYLRDAAGFPYSAFGINNVRSGLLNLSYGNAILSRHPLAVTETVAFGQRRVGEKGFLFAEIEVAGLRVPYVNLHLHSGRRIRRMRQLDLLIDWLKAKHRQRAAAWAVPPVICGDFNNPATRDDATAALLKHLSAYGTYAAHPRTRGTFPSPMPRRTLDFVLLPPGCTEVRTKVVRTMLSDHLPVVVDFTLDAHHAPPEKTHRPA